MKKLGNKGQGLTEYITLLVLVSLAAVGITQSLGKSVQGALRKARDRINTKVVFGDKKSGGGILSSSDDSLDDGI